jgi:uncharacterized membrane protein
MKKYLALLAVLIVPIIAFGADFNLQSGGIVTNLTAIINQLIPFIIGIAVFIFIVGLIRYVNAGGDEEKIKAARNTIIWGLIIIFVMFSAVGIVNILNNTFNFNNQLDQNDAPSI